MERQVATSRVPVTPDTLEELLRLKRHPRETHDDVIRRLIDEAKKPAKR